MLDGQGNIVWSKHEEQPREGARTGWWDFKKHVFGENVFYSYHDQTGEYDDYGKPTMCNRYSGTDDVGNPEKDKNAYTFGPTTGNVGYPQSRFVADANKSFRVLVSTSEYARYAHFYLPDPQYVGSVTGVLGYYMDNGKYDPDGGEWAITPNELSNILPEAQAEGAEPRWIPTEWKLGTPQPAE
jgi:hypothetical protein